MKPAPLLKVMSRELKGLRTGIGTSLISGIKSISTSIFTIPGQYREIITQKIPRETLKNRTPAPGKETAGKSPSFPELPGFEPGRLEKRYTSVFYLFSAQDSPGLASTVPTAKNVQTFLQPHLWLSTNSSLGTQGSQDSRELSRPKETWQRADAARVINLRSVAEPGYADPHPVMTHFSGTGDDVTESRIKEIEQTIITNNKELENQLKDAAKTSRTRNDFPGGPSSQPGVNFSHLTDGVYKLILERVKRERKMLGL